MEPRKNSPFSYPDDDHGLAVAHTTTDPHQSSAGKHACCNVDSALTCEALGAAPIL